MIDFAYVLKSTSVGNCLLQIIVWGKFMNNTRFTVFLCWDHMFELNHKQMYAKILYLLRIGQYQQKWVLRDKTKSPVHLQIHIGHHPVNSGKKSWSYDQHMWVIGMHQNRPAHTSKLTWFRVKNQHMLVILHACAGKLTQNLVNLLSYAGRFWWVNLLAYASRFWCKWPALFLSVDTRVHVNASTCSVIHKFVDNRQRAELYLWKFSSLCSIHSCCQCEIIYIVDFTMHLFFYPASKVDISHTTA